MKRKAAMINLSRGQHALVDLQDLQLVSFRKWYADPKRSTMYARTDAVIDGKRTRLYMHRVITGAPKGKVVDHINGNGLDNRRANLRICCHSKNGHNRRHKHNPHGRTGITWDPHRERWVAQITVNYKYRALGRFKTKSEAIAARAQAEKELL